MDPGAFDLDVATGEHAGRDRYCDTPAAFERLDRVTASGGRHKGRGRDCEDVTADALGERDADGCGVQARDAVVELEGTEIVAFSPPPPPPPPPCSLSLASVATVPTAVTWP